jgi:alpha-glucosidase
MPYLYSAMVRGTRRISLCWRRPSQPSRTSRLFRRRGRRDVRPCLLAAPVLRDGAREVEVYLPRGPESWRDFYTGRVYEASQNATIPAPLDRLPLVAPAGAIVATTDNGDDYSRLHDEPSRALRVFPGPGVGTSRAALIEDDGISLAGPSARVTIALSWTASRVRVAVGASGNYPLPYQEMRVILPEDETRTVELSGADGIGLRL